MPHAGRCNPMCPSLPARCGPQPLDAATGEPEKEYWGTVFTGGGGGGGGGMYAGGGGGVYAGGGGAKTYSIVDSGDATPFPSLPKAGETDSSSSNGVVGDSNDRFVPSPTMSGMGGGSSRFLAAPMQVGGTSQSSTRNNGPSQRLNVLRAAPGLHAGVSSAVGLPASGSSSVEAHA